MLGLCGCVGCSLATASGGYSRCSARASDYGDFSCWGAWAVGHERFRSCGSYRFNSCGYGLSCSEARQPGSGIKSISPGRLTGRFFTTEPPEKLCSEVILMEIIHTLHFFLMYSIFKKSFSFTAKLRGRYRNFCANTWSFPRYQHSSPGWYNCYNWWKDTATSFSPKYIVYIRAHC